MGESSSFTPALSPLVVYFVAGQGMTIKFFEALKTGNRPEVFLNRIGRFIRPHFQTRSLIETFEKWLCRGEKSFSHKIL
jgi:hypothetical protein